MHEHIVLEGKVYCSWKRERDEIFIAEGGIGGAPHNIFKHFSKPQLLFPFFESQTSPKRKSSPFTD